MMVILDAEEARDALIQMALLKRGLSLDIHCKATIIYAMSKEGGLHQVRVELHDETMDFHPES
jgi:hypothetical protein